MIHISKTFSVAVVYMLHCGNATKIRHYFEQVTSLWLLNVDRWKIIYDV